MAGVIAIGPRALELALKFAPEYGEDTNVLGLGEAIIPTADVTDLEVTVAAGNRIHEELDRIIANSSCLVVLDEPNLEGKHVTHARRTVGSLTVESAKHDLTLLSPQNPVVISLRAVAV